MKTVKKIGRFAIVENRKSLYLRWWNPHAKKTISEKLGAKTLEEAKTIAKERIRVITDPSETIRADSNGDPTFGEVWLAFEQEKRASLGKNRFRLLENRRELYFRPHLWSVRMSKMGPALRDLVKALQDGTTAPRKYSGRKGEPRKPKPLHPNTINDIISSAIEVCAIAKSDGVSAHNPPRRPTIAGTTAPADRDPKGRYLTFEEIGKLIELCRRPHVLELLLLDLGCGARIGAVADLRGEFVHQDLGVIDLLGAGIETNKRKPIAPITGPMGRILDRLVAEHGDGYLIHAKSTPLALSSRNWTQMFKRLVARAGIDKDLEPGATPANWYSIRRTFADWLDERVSDAAISAVMGHFDITKRTRSQLFDAGSPMTEIYKRRKLAPVLEVAKVLEAEWWPSIQAFTSVDLGSNPAGLMHEREKSK
ncbi:tyrosine-type recombinase/integrase [Rhodovulum sp. FJ3]|uniref:tyrosine-type recombinase/integrase n=1 Tax=Rhodovulum sp. FJ3 TaxID=3079053 RepID=UPI00293DAEBA|nr:tyrosine-type recombinase/integrase [Rhodovulum sp. FJ3]MDV4166480.1 tyrosine-type recombinase/integrase [Rhodovulum sp. FJ3]